MVSSLTLLLCLLGLGTAAPRQPASEQGPVSPHLTGCVSNDMTTFRCSWNVGTFQNLSQPGDLRLFYSRKSVVQTLGECPQYGPPGANVCFFGANYTSIWMQYSVQLFSRDRGVLYDEDFFHIESIVQPDPPVGLNWTLLTVALGGTYFDTKLSWEAPQTADVQTGWMRLQYEVQHREGAAAPWKAKELQRNTETSLYGLQTDTDHEVRVRSKMLSSKEFGAFSDSILIRVPSKASRFPIAILIIFAALCFIGVLMLVMQQKLMVILLPPVPGPKIRGIDPELLRKCELSELMSVLGTPGDLKGADIQGDPWVEFIDLDMEEEEEEEAEEQQQQPGEPACGGGADGSPPSAREPLSSGGSREDSDSGRDSCSCSRDVPPDHGRSSPRQPVPRQLPADRGAGRDPSPWAPREPGRPLPRGPAGPADLYTQVSHVQRSGEVLLTPGEEEEEEEEKQQQEEEEEEEQQQEEEEEKEKENVKADFQRVTRKDAAEAGGYSSVREVGKMGAAEERRGGSHPGAYTAAPPQSYTLVEGVDKENSLLLRPNTAPGALLLTSKAVPTPQGYLTPDLLRDITP